MEVGIYTITIGCSFRIQSNYGLQIEMCLALLTEQSLETIQKARRSPNKMEFTLSLKDDRVAATVGEQLFTQFDLIDSIYISKHVYSASRDDDE